MMSRLEGWSWARIAFMASAGAAALHLAAVREHIEEWAPAGAFMLVLGLLQAGWALAIVRQVPRYAIDAGIALNAGAIAVWVFSRTVGLPIGPDAGMPEDIHSADVLATLLEVLVIASAWLSETRWTPSASVVRASACATALTVVVWSHEPTLERVTAVAALALLVVGRALIVSWPELVHARRKHVEETLARSRPAVVSRLGFVVVASRANDR